MNISEKELIETVVDKMKEHKVNRREVDREYKALDDEVSWLYSELRNVLPELEPKYVGIIEAYMFRADMLADKECEYLYMKGAVDCVKLLVDLGVV